MMIERIEVSWINKNLDCGRFRDESVLLAAILEDQYEIIEVSNGRGSCTSSHSTDRFFTSALDIMMPKMDGFEVLTYINKYHWNDTLV